MTTHTEPLRIVRLTAENVKRIRAVEISPTGDVVTITGRNAQGKSSVLDAIWLALGGGTASKQTSRPIRDGEDHAKVVLDLGDFTVTRTWKGDRSTLTVASADGATYSSPQRILDGLIGKLTFDPLAFTRLSTREQRDALLDLVDLGVNLEDIDRQRAELYAERTDVGRQGKALGDVPAVDDSLPDEEVSASDLIAQIRTAERQAQDIATANEHTDRITSRLNALQAQISALMDEVDVLNGRRDDLTSHANSLPVPADIAPLEAQLAEVEDTNARIRANRDAKAKAEAKAALVASYQGITARIDDLDHAKADALASAQFPVDGLGFDETGVTLNGIPFVQASSAEQIRVSLAMAMAANPKLRVIRIMDGSLLDDESMQLIAESAKAGGYQVWIERVSDPSESAVVIEDGQVLAK